MSVLRLDHSIVAVSDLERSNRFYRDVLGAEVVGEGHERVGYRFGDTQLNVHHPGVDLSGNVARVPVRPGNSDLCFVWAGRIDEAISHLEKHDVAIETGPIERHGAGGEGTSVYFRDPDGSLLEFISYSAPPVRAGVLARLEISATDYHTAGEPFRIVADGLPDIPGETVRARREHARGSEDVDRLRRLLCHEPRGHADMYGGFLVPPDDDGADLGVLFWHKDGYSTACGHGTIALGAWAVESGRVEAPADGHVDVTIDVPSGRVVARVRCRGGAVEGVAFRNVPSFVIARGVEAGGVEVDVAYGGAIYAFAPAESFGLRVVPDDLPELIAAGRAVKRGLAGSEVARHPHDDRLSGIYGTVLYEELGPLHRRNVAIFADGEVDRSPTGSATSAATALLYDDGTLREDRAWRNDSIVGTTFAARAVGQASDGLLTEVEGTAFRTGEHRFVLDPRDPLGTGFVLR